MRRVYFRYRVSIVLKFKEYQRDASCIMRHVFWKLVMWQMLSMESLAQFLSIEKPQQIIEN